MQTTSEITSQMQSFSVMGFGTFLREPTLILQTEKRRKRDKKFTKEFKINRHRSELGLPALIP